MKVKQSAICGAVHLAALIGSATAVGATTLTLARSLNVKHIVEKVGVANVMECIEQNDEVKIDFKYFPTG